MKRTWKYILSLALALLLSARVAYAENFDIHKDSTYLKMAKVYFDLYGKPDKEKEFYEMSEKMKKYFLEKNRRDGYYTILFNEILYDTDIDKTFRAIEKANEMLKIMKENGDTQYDLVYNALGTIYKSRGNYQMAKYYYLEALRNVNPKEDKKGKARLGVYCRLANLTMLKEPEEAKMWNERSREFSKISPDYYQIYLSTEAAISFTTDHKSRFEEKYKEYKAFKKENPNLDNSGEQVFQVVDEYFQGHYDTVLRLLNEPMTELDDLDRITMRIKVLRKIGRIQEAFAEYDHKAEIIDSLRSDMLFDNINEINAEMEIAQMRARDAEKQNRLYLIIIALTTVIIITLVLWNLVRRRHRLDIQKKNKDLKIALEKAEESDRMKTAFIESVSHEIRTPLNAITGFSQLMGDPNYELGKEEKTMMVNEIETNVRKITQIVNELLELSENESISAYEKDEDIPCDSLLNEIIAKNKEDLDKNLEITLVSHLPENFTIRSNRYGLANIVNHIIKNAVKFTDQGFVEVGSELRDGQLLISVTDTGCGIPEDKQDLIFERFYKVDSFKAGIGLGLTVSKSTAQKLGGNLTLDKSYTYGCRFVLNLPLE